MYKTWMTTLKQHKILAAFPQRGFTKLSGFREIL